MPIWNERIHEKRLEKGITLAQIADRLGVTEATAQRYERGNIKSIPYEHMCVYGEILNCSPAYLMGWDEEDFTIQKRYTDLEAIEKILSDDGYTLCCENYDVDYFHIKDSFGKTIAGLYDYELLPKYDFLKKKGTITAEMLLSSSFTLYPEEQNHIKKYRALDPHGKEMVDFTLQKEWERSTATLEYIKPDENLMEIATELSPRFTDIQEAQKYLSQERIAAFKMDNVLLPDSDIIKIANELYEKNKLPKD